MNKRVLCAAAVAVSLVASAFAEVKKPSIKPAWSGAKVATWTMDYEAALEKASSEGKYTLMYFAGMWWCPRCQEFEKWVLTNSKWKKFVKDRGLYLTVLDHPYRDGQQGWCWLWEPSYLKSTKMSAEDATRRIIEQYNIQEMLYDPAAFGEKDATNFVVTAKGKYPAAKDKAVFTPFAEEPTTAYHSINYPGVLIFAPDGTVAGRFIPDTSENKDYTEENALEYCMAEVDKVINPSAIEPWVGNQVLAFSAKGEKGYGSLTLKVDKKGKVNISGMTPTGTKVSTTSTFITGTERCLIPVKFNKKDETPAFTVCIDLKGDCLSLIDTDDYSLVAESEAGVALPESVTMTLLADNGSIDYGMSVASNGKKLVADVDSKIKLTYTPKTGVIKGSFKIGKEKVTVNGVYCKEGGYGTAMIGKTVYGVQLKAAEGCHVCGL